MIHSVLHILGIDTQQSYWYDFWSGIATQASLLFAAIAVLRRCNCHVHRCWRIGRHPVGGTSWQVCRRHHPADGRVSHGDVIDAHRRQP